MAQTTILTLLPQTTHPGPSNQAVSVFGEKQQAAAYYLANRDLQTITSHFSSTFEGTCRIQASLVADPGVNDWFTVYTIDSDNTKNGYHNLNGNFVWIRATLTDWTVGPVILVTASY